MEVSRGFVLGDVARWTRFVQSGELARTLTRICVLCEGYAPLAYRLVERGGRCTLVVEIGELRRELAVPTPRYDARPRAPLETLLDGINAALAEAGSRVRLAIVDEGRAERVVLEDGGQALAAGVPVPALETMPEDGSLASLVAAYAERLARFAGLEGVRCTPHYLQEPGVLSLTLLHQPPGRGGLQVTAHVPYVPELELQPLLDQLNGLPPPGSRRLYRIARDPDRIEVALLDKATAATLRRSGQLVEHPAKPALRALAGAGCELPALWGEWRYWAREVARVATQARLLARGLFELGADVALDKDAVEVTWRVGGVATPCRYPIDDTPATSTLGRVIGDLNRLLPGAHRFVVMRGAPYFHAHRLLLLDRAWLAIVAPLREVVPGCLDEATRGELEHVLGAFPAALPASEPARAPRVVDIVGKDRIQSNDFKCSARPGDMLELIEGIARFARVALEVSPEVAVDGDELVFTLSHLGTSAEVRLANTKYVDVSPLLAYLNAILAARSPRRQLLCFRGGGYSGGLVSATDAEAAQLAAAGYVD